MRPRTRLAAKALAIWFGILILAIGNGMLREAVLVPVLGEAPGLMLSGVLLAVLILAMAYILMPWLGPLTRTGCLGIGIAWLSLTLVFEFSFGRLMQGKSWSELLGAYTFEGGNLWSLVLLTAAAAPCIAAGLRSRRGQRL